MKTRAYVLLIIGSAMISIVADPLFALGIALFILGMRALFAKELNG